MKYIQLFNHTATITKNIIGAPLAADKAASSYFRKHKKIGSKERKFISDTAFAIIRNFLLIKHLSNIQKQNDLDYCNLVATTIMLGIKGHINDFEPNILFEFTSKINKISIENAIEEYLQSLNLLTNTTFDNWINSISLSFNKLDSNIKNININENISDNVLNLLSIRYSMPSWILKSWLNNGLNISKTISILNALLDKPDVSIRINDKLISINEVFEHFIENDINADISNISPVGITLAKRPALQMNPLYRKGLIEVQDAGSQLVSYAVSPEQHWKILDACAGAGGKSLHLASIQNDRGKIIALDITNKKIKELNKRAHRSGYKSISAHTIKPNKSMEYISSHGLPTTYDAVLVDAPCSGMGTVKRDPVRKYKLTSDLLKRLTTKQLDILTEYSNYVRKGGVLVYATCSLMYEENQSIINNFLEYNDSFSPYPLDKNFKRYGINISLENNQFMVNITPDRYKSDGFFVAKMIRNN